MRWFHENISPGLRKPILRRKMKTFNQFHVKMFEFHFMCLLENCNFSTSVVKNTIWSTLFLSQFSRNFAKNGSKSFAFREKSKTQNWYHSNRRWYDWECMFLGFWKRHQVILETCWMLENILFLADFQLSLSEFSVFTFL